MKKKDIFKAGSLLSLIGISFIIATLVLSQTGDVIVEQVHQREWKASALAWADPGVGVSGLLYYFVVDLTDGAIDYNTTNLTPSLGKVMTHFAVNNSHANSSINHSTNFAIGALVRWNATHAYDSGNNTWVIQYVNCSLHNAALSINGNMARYNYTGYTGNTYLYTMFVSNGLGPHSLTRGQTVNGSGSGWTGILLNFTAYY